MMLANILEPILTRRQVDAERFNHLDGDVCMLCSARGPDMRSLVVECLYDLTEAIDELIDLFAVEGRLKGRGYYLRICKSCRAELIGHLRDWADERRAMRSVPKDSDGEIEADRSDLIPVRRDGITVYMTREQWNAEFPTEEP